MASEPRRSNNFRFNFDLVMVEVARWPVATLIVIVLVNLMVGLIDDPRLHLTPTLGAMMAAGYSCAILGGKVLLLLMAYPRIHKARFPGSYLITSFLGMIPIFAFYALVFPAVLSSIPDERPPIGVLIVFWLFGYVLFSVLFAGFLPMQHAMLGLGSRFDEFIRAKWDAVVGRSDKSQPEP